jgi:hypothetical protein
LLNQDRPSFGKLKDFDFNSEGLEFEVFANQKFIDGNCFYTVFDLKIYKDKKLVVQGQKKHDGTFNLY